MWTTQTPTHKLLKQIRDGHWKGYMKTYLSAVIRGASVILSTTFNLSTLFFFFLHNVSFCIQNLFGEIVCKTFSRAESLVLSPVIAAVHQRELWSSLCACVAFVYSSPFLCLCHVGVHIHSSRRAEATDSDKRFFMKWTERTFVWSSSRFRVRKGVELWSLINTNNNVHL